MRLFEKILMLLLVGCIVFGGAVAASAYPYHSRGRGACGAWGACGAAVSCANVSPCGGAVAVPFGYVTTSVSVIPVTTAIAYTPVVVTAYPVVYPAPMVVPRIVQVPTYAVIR